MPYSPEDVVAHAFRARTRGYDRDEVDGFLDALADQIEQERAEAGALEERIGVLEGQLAEAADSERALKRTLITVQDAADRALVEAQEEVAALRVQADEEIAELRTRTRQELDEHRARAETEAGEVIAAARAEAAAQRERVRELQELDAGHRARLRDHLEEQLAGLRALSDPFADLEVDDRGDVGDRDPGGHRPVQGDDVDVAAVQGDVDVAAAEPDDLAHDPWRLSASAPPPPPGSGQDGTTHDGATHEGHADAGDARDAAAHEGGDADDDADGEQDRPDASMWR